MARRKNMLPQLLGLAALGGAGYVAWKQGWIDQALAWFNGALAGGKKGGTTTPPGGGDTSIPGGGTTTPPGVTIPPPINTKDPGAQLPDNTREITPPVKGVGKCENLPPSFRAQLDLDGDRKIGDADMLQAIAAWTKRTLSSNPTENDQLILDVTDCYARGL